jgi:hypothetical protein
MTSPQLRVIRGRPSDVELAALAAVLLTRSVRPSEAPPRVAAALTWTVAADYHAPGDWSAS